MELTSLLLSQLSNRPANNFHTANTNSEFNNFLNKAETKFSPKKQNYTSNNKDYYKNSNNSNNFNKNVDNFNKVDNNIDKAQNDKNNYNVSSKENIQDINQDSNEKAIVIDEKTLNKLSEILGIPSDKIMEILASLSMSVSMLQEPQNLITFLQNVFDVESPVDLLSMNNMKNIMQDLTNLAKSIDYQDLIPIDENIKDTLDNLLQNNDLKNVTLLGNKDVKQKIDELLQNLNGVVEEVNTLNTNIKVINPLEEHLAKVEANAEEVINIEEIKISNINEQDTGYYLNNQNNNQNNQGQFLGKNAKQNVELKQELFNIGEVANNSKLFNASLPKTQVLKNVNTTDVIAQMIEKMKTSIKPEVSEVKILLNPKQLGEVSLKIATQNGVITAQFTAENQKVKEIIESNFNQLRDMLLDKGIDVGALEVNVSNSDEGEGNYNMFDQFNQSNRELDKILEKDLKKQDDKIKITKEEVIASQVNYSI